MPSLYPRRLIWKSPSLQLFLDQLVQPVRGAHPPEELLFMNKKLGNKEQKWVKHIQSSTTFLTKMVESILDISRLESDKIELKLTPLSLIEVIKSSINTLHYMAMPKNISIEFSNKADENVYINGDSDAMLRIINNLISNAVKFTPEGGKINIILESDKNEIRLSVKDTGIGISNKELPYIFDEFRQVDGSRSRYYEGTGLGLAIAYKMTKLLGATIRVKSKLDKGSEFTVTIPIKWIGETGNIAKAAVKPTTQKEKKATGKTKLLNVLVVEDNLDNMYVMKTILNKYEFKILEAYDGEEGLNKAIKNLPVPEPISRIFLSVFFIFLSSTLKAFCAKKSKEVLDIALIDFFFHPV